MAHPWLTTSGKMGAVLAGAGVASTQLEASGFYQSVQPYFEGISLAIGGLALLVNAAKVYLDWRKSRRN